MSKRKVEEYTQSNVNKKQKTDDVSSVNINENNKEENILNNIYVLQLLLQPQKTDYYCDQ